MLWEHCSICFPIPLCVCVWVGGWVGLGACACACLGLSLILSCNRWQRGDCAKTSHARWPQKATTWHYSCQEILELGTQGVYTCKNIVDTDTGELQCRDENRQYFPAFPCIFRRLSVFFWGVSVFFLFSKKTTKKTNNFCTSFCIIHRVTNWNYNLLNTAAWTFYLHIFVKKSRFIINTCQSYKGRYM